MTRFGPWVQPPNYVMTVPFSLRTGWRWGTVSLDPSDPALLAALRDGIPPVSTNSIVGMMLIQFVPGGTPGEIGLVADAAPVDVDAATVTDLHNAEVAGSYTPPVAPPGASLEIEDEFRGVMVGDFTIDGTISAGGDDPFDPGGSLWWSSAPGEFFTQRFPAYIIANYTLMLTVPEHASAPFSVTLASASVFGADRDAQIVARMVVWPLSEAMTDTTSMGRDPAGLSIFDAIVQLTSTPTITATVRPPRYRFVYPGRTPIRGRQRASGVIGSIPLRGRQGDKWGLRGRQNSNL